MTGYDLSAVLLSVCKEYASDGQKLGHGPDEDFKEIISSLCSVITTCISLAYKAKDRDKSLETVIEGLIAIKKSDLWKSDI